MSAYLVPSFGLYPEREKLHSWFEWSNYCFELMLQMLHVMCM